MNIPIFSLLIFLCPAVPLLAQENGDDPPRQARGRLAYLLCTSIPEELENPVAVMTGKKITRVALSKRMVGDPVKIPSDGIIKIVRQVANPANPEQLEYLTLAQTAIPDGVSQALIILVPAPTADGKLKFVVKVQDLAAFKGGDYLYLNLSTLNIGVELGTEKLLIKPGETKIYGVPVLDKSTNVATRYSFYSPTQEKWKVISASTVVLQSTRREICVFSWDSRFNRLDYLGITFPVTP